MGLSSGQEAQHFRVSSVFEHKVLHLEILGELIQMHQISEQVTILFRTILETSALRYLLTGRIMISKASQFEGQFGHLILQGGIVLTSHLNALNCFPNVFLVYS